MLQLKQVMQPQTPAEVFGTYIKGTLVNLTGDMATESNDTDGGLRDLRQVDIGEFDRTEVQEGVHGHQPDPGSCHVG